MGIDQTPLTFGKHKGLTPDEVAEIDPRYIVWMWENIKPRRCSYALKYACEQEEMDKDDYPQMGDGHDEW